MAAAGVPAGDVVRDEDRQLVVAVGGADVAGDGRSDAAALVAEPAGDRPGTPIDGLDARRPGVAGVVPGPDGRARSWG